MLLHYLVKVKNTKNVILQIKLHQMYHSCITVDQGHRVP